MNNMLNLPQLQSSEPFACLALYASKGRASLYPTACRLHPQAKSVAHAHYEAELFYIIAGRGEVYLNETCLTVRTGDLIHIPSFSFHAIENTGTDDLLFLSIYSEDYALPPLPETVHLTAAPPTPNGPLHLGHLSGPYLANDVLARYLRLRGVQVMQCCGTDDHQNYVAPVIQDKKFLDTRARIRNSMQAFQIHWDEWIEPLHDKSYQETARRFFQRAKNQGVIKPEWLNFPLCESCNAYLYDALIYGQCPFCLNDTQGTCEECGMVTPPHLLLHAKCKHCNIPASAKSTLVFTFNISDYLAQLLPTLYQLGLSAQQTTLLNKLASLRDYKFIVTHPDSTQTGLRYDKSDHVLNVWFEMAAYYERFAHSQITWVHCFGFDNTFHYLFFMGTLLKAMQPSAKLPDKIVSNVFLQLQGMKFSTSRDHAIWADEISFNTDYLRLYLCLNRAEKTSTNFNYKMYCSFEKNLNETCNLILARAPQLLCSTVSQQALIRCSRLTREFETHLAMDTLSFRKASHLLLGVINDMAQESHPGDEGIWLHWLALASAPFLPQFSASLFTLLNKPKTWINDWGKHYATSR